MRASGFNPYFTGLPILIATIGQRKRKLVNVSILILLDYLFLSDKNLVYLSLPMFQSLFYWITYSYENDYLLSEFYIDVSILILLDYLFLFANKKKY